MFQYYQGISGRYSAFGIDPARIKTCCPLFLLFAFCSLSDGFLLPAVTTGTWKEGGTLTKSTSRCLDLRFVE